MLRLLALCVFMSCSIANAQEPSLVERAAEIREQLKGKMPRGLWELGKSYEDMQGKFDERNLLAGDNRGKLLLLDWLLLTEDLPRVRAILETRLGEDPRDGFALVAQGELDFLLFDDQHAVESLGAALHAGGEDVQTRAKLVLSKLYNRKQEYARAVDTLATLWNPRQLSAEVIYQCARNLISLGRTNEAVALCEEAIRWEPWHEMAHYMLGNGYARYNYTELEKKYPNLEQAEGYDFEHVRAHVDVGDHETVMEEIGPLITATTDCGYAEVLAGTGYWIAEDFMAARTEFFNALYSFPEYGRAHNGVAKAIEGDRLRVSIYRDQDQAQFDAKLMPKIPQIEEYVLNWNSLSERHKKQVALSVEPWQAYIPVLVAVGSHHYIKPLYEKLSECPNLSTMADQRIGYDSRLWDDVRGCGGYTTVTGIEDVERSIYNRYNTVLHELTHQVHGLFPPEDVQRIEETYHAASARDAKGEKVFVSRYQGSSVWEYFAEGVNSYFSPRRNEFDTRDITRERLFELDTALVNLLEYYLTAPNLAACYPVGLVNAATDRVEQGDLDGALIYANRALERDSVSEVAWRTLSRIHSLRDQDSLAISYGEKLRASYGDKAASYSTAAWARFMTDGSLEGMLATLEPATAKLSGTELLDLRTILGSCYSSLGEYDKAIGEYRSVLAERSTEDGMLYGIAESSGLAGDSATADSMFQVAVQRRTGVVSLRLAFVRFLLRTKQYDRASDQLAEAIALKPGDGRVEAHVAWLSFKQKDKDAATQAIARAIEQYPDEPLIQAINAWIGADASDLLRSELAGQSQHAVPYWIFNTKESSYEVRNAWDAESRRLLKEGI
ncbi:tetratricopeptide repeat protein [bacterium]|nr:tetratricopeptide repeat protein [bacterium]